MIFDLKLKKSFIYIILVLIIVFTISIKNFLLYYVFDDLYNLPPLLIETIILIPLTILIGMLIYFVLQNQIFSPIKQLNDAITALNEEDYEKAIIPEEEITSTEIRQLMHNHNVSVKQYQNMQQLLNYELEVINDIGQKISHSLSYKDLIITMMSELDKAFLYDVAIGVVKYVTHLDMFFNIRLRIEKKAIEQLQKQQLTTIERLTNESFDISQISVKVNKIDGYTDEEKIENVNSSFTVPIFGKDNSTKHIVGLIFIGSATEKNYQEQHIELLYNVANQASSSISKLQGIIEIDHQRYLSLIQNIPLGVIIIDQNKTIKLSNSLARQYLETINKEYMGSTLKKIGEYKTAYFIKNHNISKIEIDVQTDEEKVFFEIRYSALTGFQEQNWLFLIRDISKRKRNQEIIERQSRLEAVGELASGMAHDFNNLLTSIINTAQLMQVDTKRTDYHEETQLIMDQSERGAELVSQILDFSRKSPTKMGIIDIVDLVKNMETLIQSILPETIGLEIKTINQRLKIRGNKTKINQLVTNLILNARDAIDSQGKIAIRIQQETNPEKLKELNENSEIPETDKSWVRLDVEDNGIGIPDDDIAKIFDPFFTTKEVNKGTGLGLSQVYGIMKQHKGQINVNSVLNSGTTFSIWFPLVDEEVTVEENPTSSETKNKRGKGQTILIVEDDESVLKILSKILNKNNYVSISANDGRKALDIYNKEGDNIDLILTDVVMPTMGGMELYEELKDEDISFLFMSGYPKTESKYDITNLPNIQWLEKPISMNKILAQIKHILDRENK